MLSTFITFAPTMLAQSTQITDLRSLILYIRETLDIIIPIIIGIAVVVFLWRMMDYIRAGDSDTKRTEARKFVLFAVIALFVMVSIYGLVNILSRTFFGREAFPEGRNDIRSLDAGNRDIRTLECINNLC